MGVPLVMAGLRAQSTHPLSLFEQLDAMLMGWLERRAREHAAKPPERATAALVIADEAMPDVERFCAGWGMSVRRPARGVVAVVEGPAHAVEGFVAIAALY